MRGIQGMKRMLRLHVKSIYVVQIAIPGLGDNGQRPPIALLVRWAVLHAPCDDGVANHADAMRVGDHDGTVEKAGLFYPGRAGHFAIAVEGEPSGKYRVFGILAPR